MMLRLRRRFAREKRSSRAAWEVQQKSKEVMEAQLGLAMTSMLAAHGCEGISAYPGPMTHELVVQSHETLRQASEHGLAAAAAAPDAAREALGRNFWALMPIFHARQHRLPQFDPSAMFGGGGERLQQIIER